MVNLRKAGGTTEKNWLPYDLKKIYGGPTSPNPCTLALLRCTFYGFGHRVSLAHPLKECKWLDLSQSASA